MTLSDIYTQQVLNNLAMFVQNPDALPFFAFPNQGTTQIEDTGTVGGPGYSSGHFASDPFGFNASRQATENWVLVPVSDPVKLALMRCAYQQAIASTLRLPMNDGAACPDCAALRSDFHGPKESATGKTDPGGNLPCLDFPPWFTWGCQKHARLPKNRACQTIGSYCGVYVCVPPECRDMLTRLTMAILDYAVNEPTQFTKRTKDVNIYLDENGKLAKQDNYVTQITATIPIDQSSKDLVALDKGIWLDYFKQGLRKKDADDLVATARAAFDAENVSRKATADNLEKQVNALELKGKTQAPGNADRQLLIDLKVKLAKSGQIEIDKVLNSSQWWGGTMRPADFPGPLRRVAEFFQKNARDHDIIPQNTPGDELLKVHLSERKGSASGGLQMLQQRLKASSPP